MFPLESDMRRVGDRLKAENAGWNFGGETANNFDDHVLKSVPLYTTGHDIVCALSDFFIEPGSTAYDIGCSTGTLTIKLAQHNLSKNGARFIGIDIEPGMIEMAQQKKAIANLDNLDFCTNDALLIDLKGADMIVCYYTVQFIRPSRRQELIDRLYEALNWGGSLLMFEKVRGPDARFQDILTALYNDYKLDQGYDASEIVSKARSLKGVLEPFSTQGNVDMLRRAGFVDIVTIMKYICFEGFLAIK
jgi:tRNA (cmo5U34)-methyltransferase